MGKLLAICGGFSMNSEEQKRVFAKNLTHYTELSGKAKSEVAKAVGAIPSAYTSWIQGISLPRMDKIQSLAEYFRINVTDLLDEHSFDVHYNERNANLANVLRKDLELSDAVYTLTQLDENDKQLIYNMISSLSKKQAD